MKRVEAVIHGQVQGVSFRHYTHLEANKLGITGWVKNGPNRTVLAIAEGSEQQLQQFVDFLHRGSPMAQVTEVEVQWLEATKLFEQFEVRWW